MASVAALTSADALLICTPERAGALPGALKNPLENASGSAAPTGGADAHDSLRKVLGYVHADIVAAACARVPVTRDAVGPEGTITDPHIREQIAATLTALAEPVAQRDADTPGTSSRRPHVRFPMPRRRS